MAGSQRRVKSKNQGVTNPKSEILNPKQSRMTKIQNSKQYDLGQGEFWYSNFEFV